MKSKLKNNDHAKKHLSIGREKKKITLTLKKISSVAALLRLFSNSFNVQNAMFLI